MRKSLSFIAATLAVVLLAAGAAAGDEHEHEETPLHPHALVIGGRETPTGFVATGCVDLAANQAVPLNAHHAQIHTGAAGAALDSHTGNFVVPLAPFADLPWTDCDSLFEAFGVTIVRGKSGNHS